MNDPLIRQVLRKTELLQFINDPNSKVVEELKLPAASARIDFAVVNGHLHGYEIKSAQDTLQRLPSQIIAYSKVFDYLTVVTEEKYYERILKILPEWVSLSICSNKDGENQFNQKKDGFINQEKSGFHVAKLLWKDEVIDILSTLNIPFKKKQTLWNLCDTLSKSIEISKLSDLVREKLKKREQWKPKEEKLLTRYDGFDLFAPIS